LHFAAQLVYNSYRSVAKRSIAPGGVAPFIQTPSRTRKPNLLFLMADDHAGYARQDGYETHDPTPGRYLRLYNLGDDPKELNSLAGRPEHETRTETFKRYMLTRFLTTHPEAASLPVDLSIDAKLDWFLRPRDA
jgi:hypothetical protein